MPKRRVKEEKPRKKISKKQILLPPIIVGAATLAGLLIMTFIPAPSPINICLKGHNTDTFNVHSRINIEVNGKKKLLPDNLGKQPKDGHECLRVIHSDDIGDSIHIQFVRPIRLTMSDFMKVYEYDNKTIEVIDNSSGIIKQEYLNLSNYRIDYSYYSDGKFITIENLTRSPAFTDNFLGRISLHTAK
jgi:hypothetical protein